ARRRWCALRPSPPSAGMGCKPPRSPRTPSDIDLSRLEGWDAVRLDPDSILADGHRPRFTKSGRRERAVCGERPIVAPPRRPRGAAGRCGWLGGRATGQRRSWRVGTGAADLTLLAAPVSIVTEALFPMSQHDPHPPQGPTPGKRRDYWRRVRRRVGGGLRRV